MIQELINDLHYLNSMGETPDGDGITVNVQLWAERWVARLESDATLINAERYRWLRKNAGAWEVSRDCGEWENCETGEKFKPRVYFTAFSTGYGGMRLDDAIDAAMNGALEGPDVDAEIPLYDQTTVDALRKDAERYRRLVATGEFVPAVSGSGWALGCGSYTKPSKQDLDAAVDAMNGANPHPRHRRRP